MHETESLYDQPLYNATVYRRDLTVKDEEFWYPVAQNINVLESIAYWAASGRTTTILQPLFGSKKCRPLRPTLMAR